MRRLTSAARASSGGFTLIELMVVVLIIGILVAIALPTFLGARTRASHRAAQSDLRNGLTAAKIYFTDGSTYTGFELQAANLEPELNWVTVPAAAGVGTITIDYANTGDVVMSEVSSVNDPFCISGDVGGGGVHFGVVDAFPAASAAACPNAGW